jgi:hypothetical protein
MLVIHFVGTGFTTEYNFITQRAAQSKWILVIHGFITIDAFVAMVFKIGVIILGGGIVLLGGIRG